MNYGELTEYFEQIAVQHKLLKHSDIEPHFFRVNIEDVISGFKNNLNFPFVFLELPESRLHGETLDNVFLSRYAALTFLDKVAPGDRPGELDTYSRMELLGLDFLSRVKRDYTNFTNRQIPKMEWNDIRIFKIGPMHHNCYGMRFEIAIGEPANDFMLYKPENWLDS